MRTSLSHPRPCTFDQSRRVLQEIQFIFAAARFHGPFCLCTSSSSNQAVISGTKANVHIVKVMMDLQGSSVTLPSLPPFYASPLFLPF